jgi:AraC family transcriptional regulator
VSGLVRALAFIEDHLEDDLDGATLSAVAGLSRFHFHRAFAQAFGLGVRAYVELVRLQRAAFRLAFQPDEPIVAIALASGFASHEAFGRAWKRLVGQTPSAFRRAPDWRTWTERVRPLAEVRHRHLPPRLGPADVEVVHRPALRVIGLHHCPERGPWLAAAQRFIAWRRRERLSPRTSPTYNVVHRGRPGLSFCVGTDRAVALEPGMFVGRLPGGRCAVLRHRGLDEGLQARARWLILDWLPAAGHVVRSDDVVLQRIALFPEVAARDAVTDLIVPLA